MLTDRFYAALTARLKGPSGGGVYIAVGAGEAAWDRNPPLMLRGATRLANELARKPVGPELCAYLDPGGAEVQTATPRLRMRMRFETGEAIGTLREVGVFTQASGARDSGILWSYFVHPPIEKSAGMSLERTLHFDFTPRVVTGAQPTRYLGNSHSREVHDADKRKTECRLEKIRFDRRIFFGTAEQATELGYDRCAFCFGRAQSKR